MQLDGLMLAPRVHRRHGRPHLGQIRQPASNQRWCSDVFLIPFLGDADLRDVETVLAQLGGKARRVDASRQLCDVLRGWKTLRDAEAVVEGRDTGPWVFPTWASNAGAQDTFRRLWARILERAELRYRKPHTLRHSYASLLIQAGEPITYVQAQLGHHSAAFTLTVYGHCIPRGDACSRTQRAAAERSGGGARRP